MASEQTVDVIAGVDPAIHRPAKSLAKRMDPRAKRAGDGRVRWTIVLLLSALFAVSLSPAKADPVADFYKGKTVSMAVGSPAGGGYDAMARVIARFIGRHLPGNPTVVADPQGRIAEIYRTIARKVAVHIAERARDMTSKFPNIVVQNT